MLGDAGYRSRWEAKLALYARAGILPHEQGGGPKGTLVITRDDERGGISSQHIERIIHDVGLA